MSWRQAFGFGVTVVVVAVVVVAVVAVVVVVVPVVAVTVVVVQPANVTKCWYPAFADVLVMSESSCKRQAPS